MPKTVDARTEALQLWFRVYIYNNLSHPPYACVWGWGCGRLLHALNHTLQCLLVSTVLDMYGVIPISLNDFYTKRTKPTLSIHL